MAESSLVLSSVDVTSVGIEQGSCFGLNLQIFRINLGLKEFFDLLILHPFYLYTLYSQRLATESIHFTNQPGHVFQQVVPFGKICNPVFNWTAPVAEIRRQIRIRALALDEGTEYEKRIHLFFIVNIKYVTHITRSRGVFQFHITECNEASRSIIKNVILN